MILLKSVLSAIPIFLMSSFLALVGVIDEMEKILRGFLWSNNEGNRRIHWFAWEQVCKGANLGGLGLGFLSWRNKALLLKWHWRFGNERNSLWRRVINTKYGFDHRCILAFK